MSCHNPNIKVGDFIMVKVRNPKGKLWDFIWVKKKVTGVIDMSKKDITTCNKWIEFDDGTKNGGTLACCSILLREVKNG